MFHAVFINLVSAKNVEAGFWKGPPEKEKVNCADNRDWGLRDLRALSLRFQATRSQENAIWLPREGSLDLTCAVDTYQSFRLVLYPAAVKYLFPLCLLSPFRTWS